MGGIIFRCPHCGQIKRTRSKVRLHLYTAHNNERLFTPGERSMLSGRAKRVKITLPKEGNNNDNR